MPPLVEGEFSRLAGALGFVLAVVLFRAREIERLLIARHAVRSERRAGLEPRGLRWRRIAFDVSAGLLAVAVVLIVVAVVRVAGVYSSIREIAQSIDSCDQIVREALVRTMRARTKVAYQAVAAVAAALVVEFVISTIALWRTAAAQAASQ